MKIDALRPSLLKIYWGLFYLTCVFLFLRGGIFQWDLGAFDLSLSSARTILFILLAAGAACWFWCPPRTLLRTSLDPVLILWIPVLLVSALLSWNLRESLGALGVVLCYGGFYYLVAATVKTEETVQKIILLGALLVSVVCFADLIYFLYVVSISPVVPIVEDFPFWPGKNMLGLFSVLNFSLAAGFLLAPDSVGKKGKFLASAVLILSLAVLVITFSRSAWLSLAGVLATLSVLRPKIFIPLIVSGLIVFALFAPYGLKGRVVSSFNPQEENVKERLRIWKSAVQMVKENPLSGVGLGAFHQAYLEKYRPRKLRLKWAGEHAHNLYLHVAAETGVLGLVTLLLTFGFLLRRGRRYYLADSSPFSRAVRLGCLLALIGFMVYSMTDCTFNGRFSDASMFHINLVMLMIAALTVRERILP